MKNYIIALMFIGVGQWALSQVVYPTPGQQSYTVPGGQTITIADSESITLKPNTHIQSGATFTAKLAITVPYTNVTLSSNENYVFTQTFQKEMTYFDQDYAEESAVIETVTYYDGLGRPMQKIDLKAAPDINDIVTHIGYDLYGRQDKEWLPYKESAGEAGSFRSGDIEAATKVYYAAQYPREIKTNYPNPFSEKKFENSPLNRVLQQAAPGYDWRLGGGHEIAHDYLSNNANEIRLFTVTFTDDDAKSLQLGSGGTTYYNAGELYKSITKDENWTSGTNHTTEEFKDKQGRVVLKRTYNNEAHDTYYVYDDFGNLTYVIPPKVDTTDGVDETELNELCYQYKYDHRNRLIEKKTPGKGWEYFVYNKLDQPVMTQNANQRVNNEWLFTKYDAFGRVAYMGIDSGNSSSRRTLQTAADTVLKHYVTPTPTANTYAGTPVYYSNDGYPGSFDEVVTIHYYDHYVDTEGLHIPDTIYGQAKAPNTQGLPTVNKVKVLGTNQWIITLTGYDKKGRSIYTTSRNNYLGTTDVVETKLNFTGKTVETTTTHTKGDAAALVTKAIFTYDHVGRLLKQTQSINGRATEVIAQNVYDDLGQVIQKKVGNTESTPLQTIDYTYNIRGWLKRINKPVPEAIFSFLPIYTTSIGDDGTIVCGTPQSNPFGNSSEGADGGYDFSPGDDLFALEINYNTVNHGGVPLYNGNIAETQWRTASRDNSLKWYIYGYDPLNRIVSATDNTGNYNLSHITYDKMGNLLTLQRQGHTNSKATTFGVMDNLVYTYGNGNKLLKVQDSGHKTYGFRDGTDQTFEFTYDANGNLLTDANKGITGIQWNHLNMPTEIKFNNSNAKKINYIYSADGTKVRKIVNSNGNIATTDYAGAYQYINNNLEFIRNIEDGYVYPKNGGNYGYVYYYTDQLDNIRLMYSDTNGDGTVTTNEIIKEAHFYPFGLVHKGYNNVVNPIGSSFHKYDYQNQERQDELGLNWLQFKYRMHDPAIGRFVSIDPLAEDYIYNSTYSFAENKVIKFSELEGLEITLNKFDRINYYNRNWLANIGVFVANAEISMANGFIGLFNYVGDLDRKDMLAGGFGKGAGSKFFGDFIDAKNTLAGYISNTSFKEVKADIGNMLSSAETYENLVGGLMGIGTIGKAGKLLSKPVNVTTAARGVMNPSEIHFMQSSIKNTTGNYTVLGNAEALANGTLNPNVLRMNVWKDASGKVWTLDHRRLGAFKLSGLQEAPIQWANPSGQMWKMTTTNGGASIKLKLGGGNSMIIK